MEFICYASNIIIYCMQSLYTAIAIIHCSFMLKWKNTWTQNIQQNDACFATIENHFFRFGEEKDVD